MSEPSLRTATPLAVPRWNSEYSDCRQNRVCSLSAGSDNASSENSTVIAASTHTAFARHFIGFTLFFRKLLGTASSVMILHSRIKLLNC